MEKKKDHLVTKSEFLEVERDRLNLATKVDINNIKEVITTKTDITEIKIELKWLKAAMVGIFGLLIKIAFFS